MRLERRRLLLSAFSIVALHHHNARHFNVVGASHVGSYASELERDETAPRFRALSSSTRTGLEVDGPPECCANLKHRRLAEEANEGAASSSSSAGSASNSTVAITGGVILMLVLAALLLYMGILDLSEILPFVEMADNDCGGDAADDDAYVMQYDENDEY
jgi:hypothetical protein